MARIMITTDDWQRIGELSDAAETIGNLDQRETAVDVIATIAILVSRARAEDNRNATGVAIQSPEGENR